MLAVEELLNALKAAGEPTRLRILAVLDRTELTVSELCRVLGQTQPRVSRHLKVMCDASLLERHAEGTSAFYRPSSLGLGRALLDSVEALIDRDDPALLRDAERLDGVRAERAEAADRYFESVASDWDRVRDLHVADAEVEEAMLAAVADRPTGDLLDIGTGTGRVLEVFADRVSSGLGIDLNSKMLNLARSRLDGQGLTNCTVQHGNAYDIDLPAGTVDIAVLHHVLHFLDDPATAVTQAARTLRPNGRLLIVDFGPHHLELLRTDYAHRRLGFTDEAVAAWCRDAGLVDVTSCHLEPKTTADDRLTVTLWVATQRHDAPATYRLREAS